MNAEHPTLPLSMVLKPASGVHLFLTEGEGILFDEAGQKLFHLNSMAACIWCHIEDQSPIESIIRSTANLMHLDEAQAHQFVLTMVRSWWRLGLLDGGRRGPSGARRDISARQSAAPVKLAAGFGLPKSNLHHYQLLDVCFSVSYAEESLRRLVHPILRHLELSQPPAVALQLDIVRAGDEWRVLQGIEVIGSCRDLQGLAPMIQGTLSSLALRRYPYLLALHAGGIARGDKAMLLVGESRSGKTTLTAALLGEGWDYLSDDMILIERNSLTAKAMPCSLGIKPGGWELLSSRFPEREPPRPHLRADGQTVRYFSPPAPRQSFLLPRTVRWIVFSSLSSDAPGGPRVLHPLTGLQRLLQHCCGIPNALESGDVHRLIEWSAGIAWFELKVADLDTGVVDLLKVAGDDRITPV